ncbi:predicted protein [Sclerotinia sclerotiorum 1980 UF-70]|uniref:Uncharacterized protein n=1 Tax=Sclerotinia sclerotiorum (strain ATCC 18683 / 1980 / Ss-1) TaxID=665079 RepID=A7E6B3_SCLS1|nr:predicted protein [Sclerotinia sclerotiorum 1980 UF-70]EDN91435.1 predicted protein [Sclerotinia sclerotiorum 1980 UF-70]
MEEARTAMLKIEETRKSNMGSGCVRGERVIDYGREC